jgi:polysaccharide export outer membrane protein
VGCGDKFFDPTQIGRFRPTPAVNVILDSLGVAEETPSAWEGAGEPQPVDIRLLETDHVFSAGDVVLVTIFELLQEAVMFADQYPVTETGKLSIPEVGVIHAAGLTESQLEEEIRDILRPSILREPSVTVRLLASERRVFSILGNGVTAPGRYLIPRYGIRLADALAVAGGISEFNVSNIFVSRSVTGAEAELVPIEPEPAGTREQLVPQEEMLEIITPRADQVHVLPKNAQPRPLRRPLRKFVITGAELATDRERGTLTSATGRPRLWPKAAAANGLGAATHGLADLAESSDQDASAELTGRPSSESRIEWVFQDGRWVPIRVGAPIPPELPIEIEPKETIEPLEERLPAQFGWEQIGTAGVQARVIRVPVDRFQSGDPRYNIVIKPGDTIYVPVDIVGEFLIMGNVNRQGTVNLTGRPMTLKMAIAAAGGLGPLAWPKRCEVIRRLGDNKEEIVMVDLDKIASGEQPDFFIKVNDLINVGTHPTARWRAILRNAFRATYGFGFIYDRNYADRDFGTSKPFGSIHDKIEDLF